MPIAYKILRFPYQLFRPVYERTSFHRAVIDEVAEPELRLAYQHCRKITREHAKTFYMATRFLPTKKQRSIFAVYALCRYLDDLVDEAEDLLRQKKINANEILERVEIWKQNLKDTYEGKVNDHPILVALSDTLESYHIPIELPFELIEGVSMDLTKNRYETFDELYDYSYKVASVVGLMTSEIFGYSNRNALQHAVDLGIAMQLTNILRDISEDLEKGRIYLPREDLDRFNITEENLFERKVDDKFREFMQFQIGRARYYYESSDAGIPMLSADSRQPVYLARQNYSKILDRIEELDYQVFKQRAYLSTSEKLAMIPRLWWKH
ncbi:MAG: phytoene/squalene synthase family protein [Cyclonatronaceae bacterium]